MKKPNFISHIYKYYQKSKKCKYFQKSIKIKLPVKLFTGSTSNNIIYLYIIILYYYILYYYILLYIIYNIIILSLVLLIPGKEKSWSSLFNLRTNSFYKTYFETYSNLPFIAYCQAFLDAYNLFKYNLSSSTFKALKKAYF